MFDYLMRLFFPKQRNVIENIPDLQQEKRLPPAANAVVAALPEVNQCGPINNLPLEVQLHIFSFLNNHAKAALRATCSVSRCNIDKGRIFLIEQQAKQLQEKIQRQVLDESDAFKYFISLVESCEKYLLKKREFSLKLKKFLITSTDNLRLHDYTIARIIIINFSNAITHLIDNYSVSKLHYVCDVCKAATSLLEKQEPALSRVWRPSIS